MSRTSETKPNQTNRIETRGEAERREASPISITTNKSERAGSLGNQPFHVHLSNTVLAVSFLTKDFQLPDPNDYGISNVTGCSTRTGCADFVKTISRNRPGPAFGVMNFSFDAD